MVPALLKLKLRKRAAAAPPAEDVISDVIQPAGSPALELTRPPIESTTSPPPPCGPPPRSYAQLTDTAHELVAASWDPNLSIRQWLDAVRDLANEAQESFRRNDLETAFIRAETVVKLLQDVLPRHHPRWRTAEPEQLAVARRHFAEIAPLHTSLRHLLLERTAQYYAHVTSANPSPAANRASPALMLRNTISAAAGVYTDSSAPLATRGDPSGKLKAAVNPVQTGPPRVNRLRNAYAHAGQVITDLARATGAASLPEPGMEDPDEGGGLLDRGANDGAGQEGSGPNAEDPLALRREGRRIPRLADTVAHLAASSAPKPTILSTRSYSGDVPPSAPLALPGESDSDGEGQQNYYRAALSPLPPLAAPAPLHRVPDPALLARMPNGFPIPPIPPTPPSFLLNKPQSAISRHLPTMTPLPPPPIPPVPPSFTQSVVAASTPPASPHSDTAVSSVPPPARIASPAASTTKTPRHEKPNSLQYSYDSTAPPPVLEVAPQAGSEPKRVSPAGTGETRSEGQLRRVILPAKLMSHFIDVIAEANTARKLETCGLLLGKEHDGELFISHLLIPQQSGTSETCSMQREEEVAAFQQQESLLTFGWIHTHPTQSIFLSSLDLHTHASYQRLLPEAIAVVCAPHEGPDAYGVFRMTDPPGLGIVLECKDEGAFHPHPPLPLYTDVDQEGGHCLVREEPFQCVDLR